jgi:hypothetical protein
LSAARAEGEAVTTRELYALSPEKLRREWLKLDRLEAEQRARIEERRIEDEATTRRLGA